MLLREFLTRVQRTLPESAVRRVATDLRLLRDLFNSVYQSILDVHPWSFLHLWKSVVVPQDYSDGTISLVSGSDLVAGSGTSWSSALAGRHLLTGEVPLKVVEVVSPTSLRIESSWAGEDLTGISYRIRALELSLGMPEVHMIHRVWWRTGVTPLREATLDYIDSVDPTRRSVGAPVVYSTRGYDATVGMKFEIWPFSPGFVRVMALRKPPALGMGDEIPFSNLYILELGVRGAVAGYLFEETGDQKWMNDKVVLMAEFDRRLSELIEQDRVASSWPQSTPLVEDVVLDPRRYDVLGV